VFRSNLGRSSTVRGGEVVCRTLLSRLKTRFGGASAYHACTLSNCFLEGFEIFSKNSLAAECLLQVFKKKLVIWRDSSRKPVLHTVSGTAIRHQVRVLEIRQMGKVGLSGVQNVLDIAAAQFTMQ
jgi:hypothetical protein